MPNVRSYDLKLRPIPEDLPALTRAAVDTTVISLTAAALAAAGFRAGLDQPEWQQALAQASHSPIPMALAALTGIAVGVLNMIIIRHRSPATPPNTTDLLMAHAAFPLLPASILTSTTILGYAAAKTAT